MPGAAAEGRSKRSWAKFNTKAISAVERIQTVSPDAVALSLPARTSQPRATHRMSMSRCCAPLLAWQAIMRRDWGKKGLSCQHSARVQAIVSIQAPRHSAQATYLGKTLCRRRAKAALFQIDEGKVALHGVALGAAHDVDERVERQLKLRQRRHALWKEQRGRAEMREPRYRPFDTNAHATREEACLVDMGEHIQHFLLKLGVAFAQKGQDCWEETCQDLASEEL